jgi:hypothetical protein
MDEQGNPQDDCQRMRQRGLGLRAGQQTTFVVVSERTGWGTRRRKQNPRIGRIMPSLILGGSVAESTLFEAALSSYFWHDAQDRRAHRNRVHRTARLPRKAESPALPKFQ